MDENFASIWATYSNQANELTTKRLTINSFFVAICAALIGVSIPNLGITSLIISFVGISLGVLWILTIVSLKRLSSAKFDVVLKLEEKMNFKPYTFEWEFAKQRKYIRITKIEIATGVLLSICFVCIVILSILKICGII